MNIIGIDPGYDRLGIAVISFEKGVASYLYSTCIQTDKKQSLSKRLLCIGSAVETIIQKYKPSLLAIETLYMTNNQKTALSVAEARGVVCYEAEKNNLSIVQMTPLQIKQALTGYGKADKNAVFTMTEKLLVIPKKKMIDDEMDALAVALSGSVYGVRGNTIIGTS